MKIIIANSNTWFVPNEKLKKDNEILFIKKKEYLKFEKIKKFSPELIFFPHWSWIVPKDIYINFKCIIFHTAPLPYGRGGSPIQNLIINDFKESPVCALKMTSKLDAGPIYSQKKISLEGPLKEIFRRLNITVNELINDLIYNLPNPINQIGEEVIFRRRIEKDNQIPEKISIEKIFDRIRMLDHENYPNSYINYGDFKVEFYDAKFIDGEIICKTKIVRKNDK